MNLTMPWNAPSDVSVDGVSAKWDEMRKALSKEADHLSQVAAQLSREATARAAGTTAPVVDAAGAHMKHANSSLSELIKAGASVGTALALTGRKSARMANLNKLAVARDLRHVRLTTQPKQTKPDFMPGISLLAGFGAGLALMYFLDPERGRARRIELGNRLMAWTRRAKAKHVQGQMLETTEAQPEPLPWANDTTNEAEGSTPPSADNSTTDTWGEQPQPSVPGSNTF